MLNICNGNFEEDIINILDYEISEFEVLKESNDVLDVFTGWIYLVGLKRARDLIKNYIEMHKEYNEIREEIYKETGL